MLGIPGVGSLPSTAEAILNDVKALMRGAASH
jgi:hypothetical protein